MVSVLGSVLGSKQEANQMSEKPTAIRSITSDVLKAVQHPDFTIPEDGVITIKIKETGISQKRQMTRKAAEEISRMCLLVPGMEKAKATLDAWAKKQPPPKTNKKPASSPKFGDQPLRADAIHNGQTGRRAVLVDTSPLFHEGGPALPKAMVSVAYEIVPATTGTAKTPGTPEIKRIVITRTETTKKDEERWSDRKTAKEASKASKQKKKEEDKKKAEEMAELKARLAAFTKA